MNAAFWTVSARLVTQVLQFLVMVIAARLLGPAEFGIFALVSAFSYFLLQISKLGWFEQIQQPEITEKDFDPIFWTAMAVSATVCATGLAAAGGLQFLGLSLGAATLAVFMVWVLVTTVTSVQFGVVMRRTGPARIGQAQIGAEVVAAIVSLIFLFQGFSVTSIALGRLAGELVAAAFLVVRSHWLPSWRNRAMELAKYFPFVSQIFYAKIIGFAQQNLSVFVIGAFMGSVGAGLFRIGARFSGALSEVVQEPSRLYAWSKMRHAIVGTASGPRETTAQVAERTIITMLFISTPLFAGMAVTSRSLTEALLGPEWIDASPVIVILCVAALLQVFSVVSEPLLTLNGHVKKLPPLSLASTIASLGGLILLAPFGIVLAATGQLIGSIVLLSLTIWVTTRYGGVAWLKIWQGAWPAFLASALMVGAIYSLDWFALSGISPFARLIAEVGLGIVVFAVAVAIFAPAQLKFVTDAVSQVFARYRSSAAR